VGTSDCCPGKVGTSIVGFENNDCGGGPGCVLMDPEDTDPFLGTASVYLTWTNNDPKGFGLTLYRTRQDPGLDGDMSDEWALPGDATSYNDDYIAAVGSEYKYSIIRDDGADGTTYYSALYAWDEGDPE